MFEVQTYCHTDNTVYYEMIEDAIDYDDARDIIAKKYPNRNVIAVIKKPLVQLAQEHYTDAP